MQAELSDNTLALYAPNRFVLDWVRDKYLNNINGLLNDFCGADAPQLRFEVGTKPVTQTLKETASVSAPAQTAQVYAPRVAPAPRAGWDNGPRAREPSYRSNVNVKHTFDNLLKVNRTSWPACGGASGCGQSGGAYNPLFLYGGTGLQNAPCCTR